jgi:hypothetical protein
MPRFESFSLHRRVMCEPDSSIRAPNIFHRSPSERVLSVSVREDTLNVFGLLDLSQLTELFEWHEMRTPVRQVDPALLPKVVTASARSDASAARVV